MKPVMQTKFGGLSGNCFDACVASLLEIDIDDVVVPMTESWYECFVKWLKPRGFYPVYQECADLSESSTPAGFHILSGKSPRGSFLHAVVARGTEIVHDPHPDRTGVESRHDVIVLVPFDPAKATVDLDQVDFYQLAADRFGAPRQVAKAAIFNAMYSCTHRAKRGQVGQ